MENCLWSDNSKIQFILGKKKNIGEIIGVFVDTIGEWKTPFVSPNHLQITEK